MKNITHTTDDHITYTIDLDTLTANVSVNIVEGCSVVTLHAVVDDVLQESTFYVQLTENTGEYEPQMGCWITASDGNDCVFNDIEQLFCELDEKYSELNMVSRAEQAYKSYLSDLYIYHDTNFNCYIDNQSLVIRENVENGIFDLILDDFSHNSACDYGSKYSEPLKSFDSLEDALDFLADFRTNEHNDFGGLYALIEDLKKE